MAIVGRPFRMTATVEVFRTNQTLPAAVARGARRYRVANRTSVIEVVNRAPEFIGFDSFDLKTIH